MIHLYVCFSVLILTLGFAYSDSSLQNDVSLLGKLNELISHQVQKAYAVRNSIGGVQGGIRFNETIDAAVRANVQYPKALLKLAVNRLPYLRQEPFLLFLSGGTAEHWDLPIQESARELGVQVKIIKLPGSLSSARGGGQLPVPQFPPQLQALVKNHPAIFLDDTYSNGGTAQAIRQAVENAGGNLNGVFVVYEGGKGDPASLYKSDRSNFRGTSLGNFPEKPTNWHWQGLVPQKIAIEMDGTLAFDYRREKLTPQGETLLQELNKIGAPVQLVDKSKPIEPPTFIRQRYPRIHFLPPDATPDLSIGPDTSGNHNHIKTVKLGSQVVDHEVSPDLLDPNYFLNRLSEVGVLEPQLDHHRLSDPLSQEPEFQKIFDLRLVETIDRQAEPGSLDLSNVLQIKDDRERVDRLSKIHWQGLTPSEQELLLARGPNLTNSYEIGQFIRIAGDSGDSRWSSILISWIDQWKLIEKGWQTYKKEEAKKALERLPGIEKATVQEAQAPIKKYTQKDVPERGLRLLAQFNQLYNDRIQDDSVFDPLTMGELPTEFDPANQPVFELGYVEIPEHDTDRMTERLSPMLERATSITHNGQKYFRYFVHPAMETYEKDLIQRYGGLKKGDFLATPTASPRTLIVWSTKDTETGFFQKVSLVHKIGGIRRLISPKKLLRSHAINELFHSIPKTTRQQIGFDYLAEPQTLRPRGQAFGQITRELFKLSDSNGNLRYRHGFAIGSKGPGGEEPLLVQLIKKSGISAEDYITRKVLGPLIHTFSYLAFKEGVIGEFHQQNVLFEFDNEGDLTGKLMLSDLESFDPDFGLREILGKSNQLFGVSEQPRNYKGYSDGYNNYIRNDWCTFLDHMLANSNIPGARTIVQKHLLWKAADRLMAAEISSHFGNTKPKELRNSRFSRTNPPFDLDSIADRFKRSAKLSMPSRRAKCVVNEINLDLSPKGADSH